MKNKIKKYELSAWAALDPNYVGLPGKIPIPYIDLKRRDPRKKKVVKFQPYSLFKTESETLSAINLAKRKFKTRKLNFIAVPVKITFEIF